MNIRPTTFFAPTRERADRVSDIELSIVMPCLNEAKSLPLCIAKAQRFLERYDVRGEIIVADNGSTDESVDIAKSLNARVVHVARKGYGCALDAGIHAAQGEFIIMGDSDDSYDFSNLWPFVDQLRHGADLVMGNRFAGGISPGAMPWSHRYLGNPLLSRLGRMLSGSPCNDFYCGLRGFTKSAYEKMQLKSSGMEFALEMLVKASASQMDVREVPTTLSPDQRQRPPHLRRWQDGWRSIRLYAMLSPRWLLWYPGLALLWVGLLCMLTLSVCRVEIAGLTFDYYTLLLAAGLTCLGFQLASLAVCARYSAIQSGLCPTSPSFERWLRRMRPDYALLAALALGGLGLAGMLVGISYRSAHEFNELAPGYLLRILIPSMTLMFLAFQLVFVSLFLSIIHMYSDWRSA